jgi:transglutaminase-like putative cysteine protease
MTAGVAHADGRLPKQGAPAGLRESLTPAQTEALLRMATFIALAAFVLAHWESVILHAPAGRAVGLLAICGAGGTLLWLSGQVELPAPLEWAARVLIVLAMVFLALLLTGLRAHYVNPHHWGSFGRHLHHGLLGAQSATYPYRGDDSWVRLTLLLAAPAFLVPAAALAFWPARQRVAVGLRFAALVLLILFYGLALAERSPHGEIGRGFALLLLVAAWLWLPRLQMRDAGAAAAVVIAAALVSLPIAAKLDSHSGWLDYRNWRVLGHTPGVDYRWDHNYGPINWPRRGTTLLYVQASQPFYWKAETLDDFDGRGWLRTSATTSVNAASELPANPDRRWFHQVKFTVAGLRGDQVIGAGTPQSVSSGAGDAELFGDGTVTALEHPLRDGENYTVNTYIPQPTVDQMRAAGRNYEGYFGVYTRMVLPMRVGRGVMQPERFDPGLWQSASLGDPVARDVALHSPYAPMYRLTKRLATKSDNAYDMVRNVERYLNTSRFAYDEHPTPRKWPLESFLFKDRVGYCQQFSGTMAMMLRMVGIPARVATGFAPGVAQPDAPGVYKVRDFDAHSWVEVYFNDIGWVTFDPTPASSPASSQTDDSAPSIGVGGRAPRGLGQSQEHDPVTAGGAVAVGSSGGSTLSWWMIPVALAVLTLVGLAGWHVRRTAKMRAQLPPDERAIEDLCTALMRLGNPPLPGATLTSMESALQRRAGPDAAGYARRLREYRYGSGGATLPRARDRRALRRALARSARPFGRLKALLALPPLHF